MQAQAFHLRRRTFCGLLLALTFLGWCLWHSRKPAKFPSYRIGDSIKFYPDAAGCEAYPDSLVCDYQSRTNTPNSIPDLIAVVKARVSDFPPQDVAVLHLRLGDGLCAKNDPSCRRHNGNMLDEPDCWNNDGDCWVHPVPPYTRYAYSKPYYVKVAQELKPKSKIIIVSSPDHWTRTPDPRGNQSQVDAIYRNNVASFLRARGFSVEFRNPSTPDEDFTYACLARTFIKGGGGFSDLVADVVDALGGQVLPSNNLHILQSKCGALCSDGGDFKDGPYFQHRNIAKMDCEAYFDPDVFFLQGHRGRTPPKEVPQEWMAAFTQNSALPLTSWYFNDPYLDNDATNGAKQGHWTKKMVDNMMTQASSGKLEGNYGIEETNALRDALDHASGIKGGRVLVIGSENPWVEACVLAAGASTVVTLEYAPIKSDHPDVETMRPADYQHRYMIGTLGLFTAVVTFSSVEHSGLGRYGDALNPWGDLLEIARAWCVTEEGGSLVIGVMYGEDALKFNAARFYGPKRFPYLATGWTQTYRGSGSQRLHVFTKPKVSQQKDIHKYLAPPHYHQIERKLSPNAYAQARQDKVVWGILGKKEGFFVEIGGFDGQTYSNTLLLEEQYQWTGLLIEANSALCSQIDLLKRRSWRLCACVADNKTNSLDFVDDGAIGGAITTMDKEHTELLRTSRTRRVECFDPRAVFTAIQTQHVDFFSLDVEGFELNLLELLRDMLQDRTLDVDVWSIEYRVIDHLQQTVLEKSLQKLQAIRSYFKKLGGYSEWGRLDIGMGGTVADETGLDVVFVRTSKIQRVSIIVPAIEDNLDGRLTEGDLTLLLRSIDQQTLPPFEVIVMLSGVSKSACARAKTQLQSPHRVYGLRIYCVSERLNQATARNRGIELAKGEWLSFIDADDEMHPKRIEVLSSYIRARPQMRFFIHAYSNEPFEYAPPEKIVDGKELFAIEAASHAKRDDKPHILDELMNSQASIHRSVPVRFREEPEFFRIEDSFFVRDVIQKLGNSGPAMAYHNTPLSTYKLRELKQIDWVFWSILVLIIVLGLLVARRFNLFLRFLPRKVHR